MKHVNSGSCDYCRQIINRYPGFYEPLSDWFYSLQKYHPEAHISCAGRGRQDQEECVIRGASRAHYGHSAHNFNCALDLFVQMSGVNLYDPGWFRAVVQANLESWMEWYGAPGAQFHEFPHVQLAHWQMVLKNGGLSPVEPL